MSNVLYRVAVIGLAHMHVNELMRRFVALPNVQMVALADAPRIALVGHLTGSSPLFHKLESTSEWFTCTGSRSAKRMAPLVSPLATELTFATPFEWRRVCVPGTRSGLQPLDQLRRVGWRLNGQCTPCQDPLDGFGHVQPRPA
jgi:hypothetical protein